MFSSYGLWQKYYLLDGSMKVHAIIALLFSLAVDESGESLKSNETVEN